MRQFIGNARRDQNLVKELRQQIGVSGRNQIAEGRSVGDGWHSQLAVQSLQEVSFGFEFRPRVVVKIDMAGQEVFGLNAGKAQQLTDLELRHRP